MGSNGYHHSLIDYIVPMGLSCKIMVWFFACTPSKFNILQFDILRFDLEVSIDKGIITSPHHTLPSQILLKIYQLNLSERYILCLLAI